MALAADTSLGRYRIRSLLSAGGMGEVYLADDLNLHRTVALKVLPSGFAHNREWVQRFEREALATSRLNHPNIVTIYEVNSAGPVSYIAMEFVEGESLRQRVKRRSVPLSEAVNIVLQAASALSSAHSAGIVHRDIKPENIMLRPDGLVKVLDFGLAKWSEPLAGAPDLRTMTLAHTHPGMLMGTIRYMSPEQARGLDVDSRTDVFSLGVLLYELLTGVAPFDGATTSDVIAGILKTEPPPVAVSARGMSAELQRILARALCKDRDQRYQTAKELEFDLTAFRRELELSSMPEASQRAAIAGAPELARKSAVRSWNRAAFVLAPAICIAAVAGYWQWTRTSQITSIAVLPFTNASGDPKLDYLSDGISDSLIETLSELPQLKVVARNSAFHYRGKDVDAPAVGKALGARSILTGRLAVHGDVLQVSADLIDARDNREIWGGHYNRQATDLQATKEEMARTISGKLRLKLTGAQQQHLAKRPTQNPQAYDAYLTGDFYAGGGGGWSSKRKAVEYFQRAIALDPAFALAYAQESICYMNMAIAVTPGLDSKEALDRSAAAAEHALMLEPELASGHNALALVKMQTWDWPGAEREFRRTIELSPNSAGARMNYASYLADVGQYAEALEQNNKAQELDPLSLQVQANRGFVLMLARSFEPAAVHLQRLLQVHPDSSFGHEYLALTYGGQGRYRDAIAEYQKFIALDEAYPFIRALMAHAYASSGQREEALKLLSELLSSKAYVSPTALSLVYIALGDKDHAFDCLQRAWAEHDNQMQYLKSLWAFDPIRSDPRFTELLSRMAFPALGDMPKA